MASPVFLALLAVVALSVARGTKALRKLAAEPAVEVRIPLPPVPPAATLGLLGDLRERVEAGDRLLLACSGSRLRAQERACGKPWREALGDMQLASEALGRWLQGGAEPAPWEAERWFGELRRDLAQYVALSRQLMADAASPAHRRRRKGRKPGQEGLGLPWGEARSASAKTVADLRKLGVAALLPARGSTPALLPAAVAASRPDDRWLLRWIGVAALLYAGFGLVWMLGMAHKIAQSNRQILGRVRGLAGGDLSEAVAEPLRGENGEIAEGLEGIRESLSKMVRAATNSAEGIHSICPKLVAASRSQTESAALQHEQLQQIVNTMLGRAGRVKEITGQALRAAQAARQTVECAVGGRRGAEEAEGRFAAVAATVGETAARLGEMGAASGRIESLMQGIEEIAGLTRKLARNAASEALEAGEETGEMGIAAWELGKLAERTLGAASEIGGSVRLIQSASSVAAAAMAEASLQMEAGRRGIRNAEESLKGIVAAAELLSGIAAHIATSAGEIAGDRETGARLTHISELGKESADAAQLTTALAGELLQIAATLQRAGMKFSSLGNPPNARVEDEDEESVQPWPKWHSAPVAFPFSDGRAASEIKLRSFLADVSEPPPDPDHIPEEASEEALEPRFLGPACASAERTG
jgi:methyl-accepting chemotaxis protein